MMRAFLTCAAAALTIGASALAAGAHVKKVRIMRVLLW